MTAPMIARTTSTTAASAEKAQADFLQLSLEASQTHALEMIEAHSIDFNQLMTLGFAPLPTTPVDRAYQPLNVFPPEIQKLIAEYFPNRSILQCCIVEPEFVQTIQSSACKYALQAEKYTMQGKEYTLFGGTECLEYQMPLPTAPSYMNSSDFDDMIRIRASMLNKMGIQPNRDDPFEIIQASSEQIVVEQTAFYHLRECTRTYQRLFETWEEPLTIQQTKNNPFGPIKTLPLRMKHMRLLKELTLECPDLLEFPPCLSLPNLEKLSIRVPLQEAAIPSLLALLLQCKKLQELEINSCRQTVPAELQQLKNSKPGMSISWNGQVVTARQQDPSCCVTS